MGGGGMHGLGLSLIDAQRLEELTADYDSDFDPSFSFLDATLVKKRTCGARSGMTYFSCRSWRASMKPFQLRCFRSMKAAPNRQSLIQMAGEIGECAVSITNGAVYDFVCPVPSGNSERRFNFSSLLASFAAREIGVPCYDLLSGSIEGQRSSSHPRQSMKFRAKLKGARPRGDIVLLVDDVTTTALHFEKCVKQLTGAGYATVCVSWVR